MHGERSQKGWSCFFRSPRSQWSTCWHKMWRTWSHTHHDTGIFDNKMTIIMRINMVSPPVCKISPGPCIAALRTFAPLPCCLLCFLPCYACGHLRHSRWQQGEPGQQKFKTRLVTISASLTTRARAVLMVAWLQTNTRTLAPVRIFIA